MQRLGRFNPHFLKNKGAEVWVQLEVELSSSKQEGYESELSPPQGASETEAAERAGPTGETDGPP